MIRVLLVQPWTSNDDPIRAALERAGLTVAIVRVDFEPALHAALIGARFDLVIYDPAIATLSRAKLDDRMRAAGGDVPLVVADDLATLGERARDLVSARSS
jgi:CheY-like chemotaxis protein